MPDFIALIYSCPIFNTSFAQFLYLDGAICYCDLFFYAEVSRVFDELFRKMVKLLY